MCNNHLKGFVVCLLMVPSVSNADNVHRFQLITDSDQPYDRDLYYPTEDGVNRFKMSIPSDRDIFVDINDLFYLSEVEDQGLNLYPRAPAMEFSVNDATRDLSYRHSVSSSTTLRYGIGWSGIEWQPIFTSEYRRAYGLRSIQGFSLGLHNDRIFIQSNLTSLAYNEKTETLLHVTSSNREGQFEAAVGRRWFMPRRPFSVSASIVYEDGSALTSLVSEYDGDGIRAYFGVLKDLDISSSRLFAGVSVTPNSNFLMNISSGAKIPVTNKLPTLGKMRTSVISRFWRKKFFSE